MNALDLVVIGVIVLSGLFAFARGFVKEALSIAGWFGAAFLALNALPHAVPLTQKFLPPGPVADAVTGIAIFIIALIALSLVTSAISRRVKASALSAVDRTCGLVFGLLRGALVVCICYLVLSWLMPVGGDRPHWMADARTRPLLESGALALERLVPGPLRERAANSLRTDVLPQAQTVEGAINALGRPSPKPAPAKEAISPEDRKRMDRLTNQAGH